MDNLRDPDSTVAVRYGYFIYHGRSDPYSARNCNYNGVGKRYSRAESSLNRYGYGWMCGGTCMSPYWSLSWSKVCPGKDNHLRYL